MSSNVTIEIVINGNTHSTSVFDAKSDAIIIGSGPTAQIIVEGLNEMHGVINRNNDTSTSVQYNSLTGETFLLNDQEQSSNCMLSDGDQLTIGANGFCEIKLSMTTDITARQSSEVTTAIPSEDSIAASSVIPTTTSSYDDLFDDTDEFQPEQRTSAEVVEMLVNSNQNLNNTDRSKKVLSVSQILNGDVLDSGIFKPGPEPVTIGMGTGHRLRFLGKPIAWVPGFFSGFSWLMYPFTLTTEENKFTFLGEDRSDDGYGLPLFRWEEDTPICCVADSWDGILFVKQSDDSIKNFELKKLFSGEYGSDAPSFNKADNNFEIEMSEGVSILVDTNGTAFFGQVSFEQKFKGGIIPTDLDYPFLSAITLLLLLSSYMTYFVLAIMERPEVEVASVEDIQALLELEEPPEPPEEENKPDSNPDAGEGAKAKKEEGKVGKKEAKMKEAKGDKVEIDKRTKDKEKVDDFMSGLDFGAQDETGALDGLSGLSSLDPQGGLGGVIGAKGVQVGSGGLGSRGSGLGGGGTADGLGGLGTKGRGRGSSGYGKGGGSVGKKRTGGSIKSGGSPIVLGALDKSLIDAVIKRHMNQIRYCYQRELTKNPKLKGKIVVKFVIAGNGTVSKASIKSSSMGSKKVEGCITGRFKRFKFPEPKGGGIVIVSYPFIFST